MKKQKIATHTKVAAAAALAAFQLSVAYAQANNDTLKLDEVVVTGSATGGSKMKQSLSISTLDSEQLTNTVASSSADLLRSVPGVRAESSGGEGNANVTVRGVPISAGGSRYVQFQEDGLPVLQIGDFNFVTPDMFLRSSLGTDGLEVVRGGSASTMATNAPGGIINFISKTGDVEGGTMSATTNVSGPSQRRVDFGYGKATSDTSSVYLSGFVRSGEGPRNTQGVNMESGGQFKASFNKDLGGGNGHPTVKPTDLMAYLCRLVTPAGGIVLDPFMGSGSTGRAAGVEQFKFVGIEINPDYFEIACRRIDAATAQQGLEFA